MFELDSQVGDWEPSPVFNPSSSSLTAGSAANFPVTLPSNATNISATCLNLPAGASCSYSTSNKAVTVTTSGSTPAGTYQVTVVFTETVPVVGKAFMAFPFLLFPILCSKRRKIAPAIWLKLCMVLVVAVGMLLIGCGGGGSTRTNPPPTQTHQVTSSAVITLTVK